MAMSYNGWPVLDSRDVIRFEAGGRSWYAADRNVATVLAYLINRFDREVEPVDASQLDDWSFAPRTVRGSSTVMSCHASGTAIDINALRHPRYARGTFDAKTKAAVRRILADINAQGPIVRWGEDFSTVVDGMHFEIVGSREATRRAADRIRRNAEDDVTPQDIAKIIDGVADEIMKRLDAQRLIPNQKTRIGDKPAADMTFTGAISNIELNQDQQTAADNERYKALSGKLDQIIGALKHPTQ